MSRVLMLARHFPPIGGAGVHRTIGSVRHLRTYGHYPVVVTGAAEHRDRWEPRDADLLASIPPDTPVHRVAGTPAGRGSRLRHLAGLPPEWVGSWVRDSVELGRTVGGDADIIYASCLPYETAFAGAQLARALGRPWIADLEDPWALDEMRMYPTGLHRELELRRMRRALATASAVVMAAPEAAERVRAAMPELARRVVVTGIPIGFEPSDFEVAADRADDGIFRIVHTGSMHTDLGQRLRRTRTRRRLLGGTVRGLDVLTRSHVFLLEALAGDSALRGRVEVHLAGGLTAADRAVADRYDFVHDHGLLPHRESVALMRSADLLFLPMHDLPPGVRAGLIPYKTYEYLAARRPILAAVPDGDVRDMLGPLPHVSLVRPADVDGIAAAARERIAAGPQPDSEPPHAYERARTVARIADVLSDV
jgi:hypothetical protein